MAKRVSVKCAESANTHFIPSQFHFYRIQISVAVVEDACKYRYINYIFGIQLIFESYLLFLVLGKEHPSLT